MYGPAFSHWFSRWPSLPQALERYGFVMEAGPASVKVSAGASLSWMTFSGLGASTPRHHLTYQFRLVKCFLMASFLRFSEGSRDQRPLSVPICKSWQLFRAAQVDKPGETAVERRSGKDQLQRNSFGHLDAFTSQHFQLHTYIPASNRQRWE